MTPPENRSRRPSDTPCRRPRHDLRGVETLDPMLRCVLTVARYQFQSFAMPELEGWTRALPFAEQVLGRDDAPGVVCGVQRTVQAMRRARRSVFQFSNPDCANCASRLCGHERLLLNTLRSISAGRHQDAEAHAMMLCEGNDTAAFLDEAAALAECLDLVRQAPWERV